MKKTLLTAVILFLVITTLMGQTKTYYKINNSDKFFTENKYEDYKKALFHHLKEEIKKVTIDEILIDSITSHDSIIKTYKLDIRTNNITNRSKRPEEKIYSYLNKELPNFNLQTIDGKNISVADLKGKPTVINFWFTRCKPCVEEMPILNKLAKKYADKVNFIAITSDDIETVTQFLKTHPFNFSHAINARNYINEVGLYAYPKNIFINKQGEIKRIKVGIPYFEKNGVRTIGTGETFERYIEELL